MASVGLIQTSVSECRPHDPITNVWFFHHTLALDQARVKFLPEYVNGGAMSSATPAVKRGVVSGKSWAHVLCPVVDSCLCTDGQSDLVGAA